MAKNAKKWITCSMFSKCRDMNVYALLSAFVSLFAFLSIIALPSMVTAAPCSVTNASLITQVTGGCITFPTRADPNPVQPDSLILEYSRDYNSGDDKMLVEGDITAGTGFYQMWNDITIQGTTSGQTNLEILSVGGIFSATPYKSDGARKTITTPKLTLDNVNLESKVVWSFNQPNNELIFKNSEIYWSLWDPVFANGTDLRVTSESGSNRWKGLSGTTIPANVTFDVKAGTTFEFFGAGGLSSANRALNFSGQTELNVASGSTLKFDTSNIDFGANSTLNLASGSTLGLRASGTKIALDTLNADGATLTYEGGDISLKTVTANLHDSTINLVTGNMETRRLVLSGTSAVTGQGSSDFLRAEVIQTRDNSATTLNATNLNQIRAETLLLTPNLTVNLDGAMLRMLTGSDAQLLGGTINIDNQGVFVTFGSLIGGDATVAINNGDVVIGETAELVLQPSLDISMNSVDTGITIEGKLSGSGTIGGSSGRIDIQGDSQKNTPTVGILSLGTASNPYGTLTTDNQIRFVGDISTRDQVLIDTGLFDGGYYDVDLGLTGGTTPINDKIVYGDGGVDITLMKALRVDVADNSTAAQLHQKSFRVIEASGSGVAGNIVMQGQTIESDVVLEEGPNVPILIDFFIADDGTNGKSDLTIYAEEQLPVSLRKHSNVRNHRNTQAVASLLPTAPTTPTVQTPQQQLAQQTVFTAMQTTTNSQVSANFTSIHPETISSNMTVQLEQADNMLNTVLAVNTLSNNRDEEMQNLGSFFFGSSNTHASGVWANINYIDGKVDGQGDLGNFDYYLTSYTFGSSFISRSNYELGSFFGFSSEAMHEHDEANIDFSSEAYHIGLYGGLRFSEKLTMSWAFGHSWLNTESRRSVSLGTLQESAEADYDAQMNYLGVRANYDTSWLPAIDSNAFAGLGYLRIDQDAFSETNAPNLGLTIDRAIASSAIVSLGVEMSRPLGQMESTRANTELRYDYDVMAEHNSEHDVRASFNFDPNNTQSFVGQNRGPHAVTFALGLDHEFDEDWLLSLAGTYTRSSHGREMGGDLVMNWLW